MIIFKKGKDIFRACINTNYFNEEVKKNFLNLPMSLKKKILNKRFLTRDGCKKMEEEISKSINNILKEINSVDKDLDLPTKSLLFTLKTLFKKEKDFIEKKFFEVLKQYKILRSESLNLFLIYKFKIKSYSEFEKKLKDELEFLKIFSFDNKDLKYATLLIYLYSFFGKNIGKDNYIKIVKLLKNDSDFYSILIDLLNVLKDENKVEKEYINESFLFFLKNYILLKKLLFLTDEKNWRNLDFFFVKDLILKMKKYNLFDENKMFYINEIYKKFTRDNMNISVNDKLKMIGSLIDLIINLYDNILSNRGYYEIKNILNRYKNLLENEYNFRKRFKKEIKIDEIINGLFTKPKKNGKNSSKNDLNNTLGDNIELQIENILVYKNKDINDKFMLLVLMLTENIIDDLNIKDISSLRNIITDEMTFLKYLIIKVSIILLKNETDLTYLSSVDFSEILNNLTDKELSLLKIYVTMKPPLILNISRLLESKLNGK